MGLVYSYADDSYTDDSPRNSSSNVISRGSNEGSCVNICETIEENGEHTSDSDIKEPDPEPFIEERSEEPDKTYVKVGKGVKIENPPTYTIEKEAPEQIIDFGRVLTVAYSDRDRIEYMIRRRASYDEIEKIYNPEEGTYVFNNNMCALAIKHDYEQVYTMLYNTYKMLAVENVGSILLKYAQFGKMDSVYTILNKHYDKSCRLPQSFIGATLIMLNGKSFENTALVSLINENEDIPQEYISKCLELCASSGNFKTVVFLLNRFRFTRSEYNYVLHCACKFRVYAIALMMLTTFGEIVCSTSEQSNDILLEASSHDFSTLTYYMLNHHRDEMSENTMRKAMIISDDSEIKDTLYAYITENKHNETKIF
jgi:hypothetical protein